MPIGIGLIGCGRRLGHLAACIQQKSNEVKIVALTDPAPTAIEWARENLNPELTIYSDVQDLVNDSAVDWVMVGSWNRFHKEHTIAAFAAGKHVFCEKPLATNIDDCLAMLQAWRASGRTFSMGFTLRYSPHYRRIRELLDQGRVGRIISMEFNETLNFCHGGFIMGDWRRLREHAGSHLLEKCCHDIDLASWMVESKAERVASFGGLDLFRPENAHLIDQVGPRADGKPAYQTWWHTNPPNPFTSDKDIVDNQVAIVEYENGVRATFHTNCNSGIPERRMYICGSEGAIRADVYAGTIEYQKVGFDTEREQVDAGVKGGHGGGDQVLIDSLIESMLNDRDPFTSLEDGLVAAITAFAIDEAMDTGTIVDVRPYWRKAGLADPRQHRTQAGPHRIDRPPEPPGRNLHDQRG